jgi:hypothetical protein
MSVTDAAQSAVERFQESPGSIGRRRKKALKQSSALAPEADPPEAPSTGPPPILVTVKEAMRLLARSQSMVYAMLASGELQGKRDGKRTLIVHSSIVKRIESLPDWTPSAQPVHLTGHEHDGRKRRRARAASRSEA